MKVQRSSLSHFYLCCFSSNLSPCIRFWCRNLDTMTTTGKKCEQDPEVSTSSALRLTRQLLPLARAWRSQSRKQCQAQVCCQDKDGNTSADLLAVSIVTQLEDSVGWLPNPNRQPAPSESHFLLLLHGEGCRAVPFSHLPLEVDAAEHSRVSNRQDIHPGLRGITY